MGFFYPGGFEAVKKMASHRWSRVDSGGFVTCFLLSCSPLTRRPMLTAILITGFYLLHSTLRIDRFSCFRSIDTSLVAPGGGSSSPDGCSDPSLS